MSTSTEAMISAFASAAAISAQTPAAPVTALSARSSLHMCPPAARAAKPLRPRAQALHRGSFFPAAEFAARMAPMQLPASRGFSVSAAFDSQVETSVNATPKKKRSGSPGPKSYHGRTSMDNVLYDSHDAVFDIDLSILERDDRENGVLFVVKVRCPDRTGLLADVLGTLKDFDYAVFNALIRSDNETGRVKNNFYVRRADCPEHTFSGDQVIRLYNALLSILRNDGFYRPAASVLADVAIEDFNCDLLGNDVVIADHEEDLAWNVIELRCPDRDYLLFEVTHALNAGGYHVNSAEVSTDWSGNVFDRIVVGTTIEGGKLDMNQQADVVDIMKSTLCKLEIMREKKRQQRDAEKARRAALLGLARNVAPKS